MSTPKDEHRSAEDQPPRDYEVGYRKPPAAFRFKKGVSGNPKGRPQRRRDPAATPQPPQEDPAKAPPNDGSPVRFTDEQLLQMVKARKLTRQALYELYLEQVPRKRR